MTEIPNLIEKKKIVVKKNKGGRPKIKDSEKKTHKLIAYFTEYESKIAINRLEEWGYNKFSRFVFDALVLGQIKCVKNIFLDKDTTVSLNKIGTNFNQISKKLNNNENDLNILIPLFEELKSQLIALNSQLKS